MEINKEEREIIYLNAAEFIEKHYRETGEVYFICNSFLKLGYTFDPLTYLPEFVLFEPYKNAGAFWSNNDEPDDAEVRILALLLCIEMLND